MRGQLCSFPTNKMYQTPVKRTRKQYIENYFLAEILRFFCLYKMLHCTCYDHLEHPASCRLSLDHDENSGNLYENWERRLPISYIYQAQQRQYNGKLIIAITLILTTKTEIADGTFFYILYNYSIQIGAFFANRFDIFAVAEQWIRERL